MVENEDLHELLWESLPFFEFLESFTAALSYKQDYVYRYHESGDSYEAISQDVMPERKPLLINGSVVYHKHNSKSSIVSYMVLDMSEKPFIISCVNIPENTLTANIIGNNELVRDPNRLWSQLTTLPEIHSPGEDSMENSITSLQKATMAH